MCELFALSASAPVDIKLSLGELARHGGETGIHADGWGVAFLEGRDARLFRDPSAAARSPWVACLAQHPPTSDTVVAHVRHATRGAVTLANTQPFARELWGRMHVFVHNGNLAGLEAGTTKVSRIPADRRHGFGDRLLPLARASCGPHRARKPDGRPGSN